MKPPTELVALLKRWDHGVHSEHLAGEILKTLRLIEQRRYRNAYDEPVCERSWVTPWEAFVDDAVPVRPPTPAQPFGGDFECCASGSCEVCRR